MAGTALGSQLTALHYQQQTVLRADTLRILVELFPALDLSSFDAVDRSWPALERALIGLVDQRYATSSGLSINYYELYRAAEGVRGPSTALLAEAMPAEDIAITMKVTGPYTAKHLVAVRDRQAAAKTLTSLSGAVARLVSEGGRATLDRSVEADKQALGWTRVTGGRPCGFCALLASQGPTYKSARTALRTSSGRKYHLACSCTVEPFYDRDAPWPGRAAEFRRLWDEIASEKSGKDAERAFRKAIEG